MLEYYSIYSGVLELIPWPIPQDKLGKNNKIQIKKIRIMVIFIIIII